MATLRTIFLILHITGGFTALLSGIIPMIAQKGGLLHRRAGWVFTGAMFDVFVTSVVLSTVIPILTHTHINLFLLFVGVFSFYFVFSGLRGLRFLRPGLEHGASQMDYMAAAFLLTFCLAFLYISFFDPHTHQFNFNIIYLVFSLFGIRMAIADMMRFRKPYDEATRKNEYFFHHLSNMLGSYIAAVTAFMVVNVHFLPGPVVWIGPGVIGGIGITLCVKYYIKKFASGTTGQPENVATIKP